MTPVLEAVFGGKAASRVMVYLAVNGEGYAQKIAQVFEMHSPPVQSQLKKMERAGVLVSTEVGRIREYTWNPRLPSLGYLQQFILSELDAALDAGQVPSGLYAEQYQRSRPRSIGKELRPIKPSKEDRVRTVRKKKPVRLKLQGNAPSVQRTPIGDTTEATGPPPPPGDDESHGDGGAQGTTP